MKIKIHNEFTVQEFFYMVQVRLRESSQVVLFQLQWSIQVNFRKFSYYLIAEKFRWKWCSHGAVQSLARCGLEEGEELEKTEKTESSSEWRGVEQHMYIISSEKLK